MLVLRMRNIYCRLNLHDIKTSGRISFPKKKFETVAAVTDSLGNYFYKYFLLLNLVKFSHVIG